MTVAGDADGRHECVGASVVAGVDAPPVLEPAEQVFDLLTLAVERPVMFQRRLPVGFRRNACGNATVGERLAKPVGVVSLVA